MGNSAKLPMVTGVGLEPDIIAFGDKSEGWTHIANTCCFALNYSTERAMYWPLYEPAISLFLRPHLFLSGLSPHATYLISITCDLIGFWMLEWVVVERVNPCIRPLRIWIVATIGSRGWDRTNSLLGMSQVFYHYTTLRYIKARFCNICSQKTNAL